MGGQAAVAGANRPAVPGGDHAAGTTGDDRLDRHDQSLGEHVLLRDVVEVGDRRRLVDGAADAVAGEVGNDREPPPPHFALDRAADLADETAGARGLEALRECRLGAVAQLVRPHWCAGQHHGAGRIGHVAVLLDGHVQLDDVAPPQPPRAGDAVHDFVVDADQHGAGKAVDERRRRARAVLREEPRGQPIEVRGRDASLRRALQRFERQADDLTRCAEPVPFSFGGDGHLVEGIGSQVRGSQRVHFEVPL